MKKLIGILAIMFMVASCSDGDSNENDSQNIPDENTVVVDADEISDEVVADEISDEADVDDADIEAIDETCTERDIKNCVDFESFERCVEGSWKTISLKHEGLEWSCITSGCSGSNSLPTIQELRTLVQNCPEVEYPEPEGLDYWCEIDFLCTGCGYDDNVEYSVFLDTGFLRSSTGASPEDNPFMCLFREEKKVQSEIL